MPGARRPEAAAVQGSLAVVIFAGDTGPNDWWDHEEEAERPLGLFQFIVALCGLAAAVLMLLAPAGIVMLIWRLLL